MNRFSRVRRALVMAAVLLTPVLSGAVGSKPAYRVYYSKEITYYNNAAHSQVVGVGYIYCNGTSTLDGTSSPYRTEEILDVCCGGVPC